jgi:hypothetical protein
MRTRTLQALILALFAVLAFAGCNADGAGIFYTISTEVKQTGGDFPMANQVVEADGTLFIRTGNSVRRLDSDGWTEVLQKNVDSIATDGSHVYAMVTQALSDGSQESQIISSSDWNADTPLENYSRDASLITLDNYTGGDDYLIVLDDGDGTFSVDTTSDFSSYSGEVAAPGDKLIIDGAVLDTEYYVVGKNYTDGGDLVTTLYTGASVSSSMTEVLENDITGNIRSVTAASTPAAGNFLFFTTYAPSSEESRVYAYDGSDLTEISGADLLDGTQVADSPEALRVVRLGSAPTPYLIVGAADGYFEVKLSSSNPDDWTLEVPTETVNLSTGSSLAAKYPDLSVAYVFSVFQAAPGQNFYLGVGKQSGNILGGLWKNHEGDFSKL